MKSFRVYLSEAKMTPMTPKEFLKYDWRIEVFLRKYKAGESFDLTTGSKMKFTYQSDVAKAVESRNQVKLKAVRLLGTDGKEYLLSALGKSAEFGGRGAGAGTAKEDMELKSLRDQLNAIKSDTASATVPIMIGSKTYKVFDVVTTPGVPKSDFHLVDINGKELVWISHKDGRGPRDFQQWGGISARAEPSIFKHPETQKFIDDLKAQYPDGLPKATTLYRKIKDTKLKMLSVYGNQYGTREGRQNVSILIQGPVKLQKAGGSYQFKSNHIHLNGDVIDGDFEPVLTAIYKGDRSDAGVKGTRIVIMPIAGRKMTGTI
jgi:hypothetical protein